MYEVLRVSRVKWSAVEFLTHWAGTPIRPGVLYARVSVHRSQEAAQKAVDHLNAWHHPVIKLMED